MLFSLLSGGFSREMLPIILITLLLRIPTVLLALSLHEAAHGFVACKLGDPTAKMLGRITINPFKHLDPFGALSMLIFGIGWAKPVPINTRYFKKPKRDMALSAAAGPLCNLLQGLIAALLLFLFTRLFISGETASMFVAYNRIDCTTLDGLYVLFLNVLLKTDLFTTGEMIAAILLYMLLIYASLNFMLALFNLIPVPPFDGSRLAFVFLPDKYYFGIMKYERFIMIGFLLFFFIGGRFGLFDVIFTGFINLMFKTSSWILSI